MTTIEDIYKHIHFPTAQDKALASMLHLATVFEKYFESQLLPFGITVPQFRILRVLRGHQPEGIAIYTLPRYLPDRKSDVSRMLVRMEKAGWVKRQQEIREIEGLPMHPLRTKVLTCLKKLMSRRKTCTSGSRI